MGVSASSPLPKVLQFRGRALPLKVVTSSYCEHEPCLNEAFSFQISLNKHKEIGRSLRELAVKALTRLHVCRMRCSG
jgi:hypothetical protein